jgi:type IV pilus assembly protein PilM
VGKSIVGLDIGTSMIRAVQLRPLKEGFAFERASEILLPRGAIVQGTVSEPEVVTRALKELWKKGKFTTNIVRLGIGGESTIASTSELDWMKDEDLFRVLPTLVADKLFIDKDQFSLDYHTLSEYTTKEVSREDETERVTVAKKFVLISGVLKESVTEIIAVVRAAKLKPISVDLNALAILRAADPEDFESDANTVDVSIDIGAENLTIVLHKFGQPLYIRTVANHSGNAATIAIEEELSIPFDKAELRKFEALYATYEDTRITPVASESSIFDEEDSEVVDEMPEDNTHLTEADAEVLAAKKARVERLRPLLSKSASDIIAEIRVTIDDFLSGPMGYDLERLSGFSISGGVSQMPGLLERISAEFTVSAKQSGPLTRLVDEKSAKRLTKEAEEFEHVYTVAAGLALGEGSSHD